MAKVVVMDHPMIKHKIGLIRRKEVGTKEFREGISEIAMLECYEATRHLELEDIEIETPICKTTVQEIKGLYRDPETLEPVEYYCKLPADSAEREIFVVDPMLATGGSALAAVELLKKHGCKKLHFLCIIAAPEGVKAFTEAHPDVDLYIGALDDHLNDHGYIVPGLGDAGDRIFGTK